MSKALDELILSACETFNKSNVANDYISFLRDRHWVRDVEDLQAIFADASMLSALDLPIMLKVHLKAALSTATGSASVWSKLFDSTSNCYYYLNSETQESRWDAPPGFVDDSSGSTDAGEGESGALAFEHAASPLPSPVGARSSSMSEAPLPPAAPRSPASSLLDVVMLGGSTVLPSPLASIEGEPALAATLPPTPPPSSSSTTSEHAPLSSPSSHHIGAPDATTIRRIMEMGFNEDDVISALIECKNDAVRASNLLAIRASTPMMPIVPIVPLPPLPMELNSVNGVNGVSGVSGVNGVMALLSLPLPLSPSAPPRSALEPSGSGPLQGAE